MADLEQLSSQVEALASSNHALTEQIIGLRTKLSNAVTTSTAKAVITSSDAVSTSQDRQSASDSAASALASANSAREISGIENINEVVESAIASSPIIANGGKSKVFSTVADMKNSDENFNVGDMIVATKYNSKSVANCPYNVVSRAYYESIYKRAPDGYLDHDLKNGTVAVLSATAGEISAIQSGCFALKTVDDHNPLYAFFNYGARRGVLRFDSGHTFAIGKSIYVNNNSDKTGETISFHIKAHGAKIFKLEFTGSAFLSISHDPSGLWRADLWKHDFWTFLWEGGDMDANGFNQHFRWAAHSRDGTGTIDESWFTTEDERARARAQLKLTAKVFGNPDYEWMINPRSSSTPTTGQDGGWMTITGAAVCTVRDAITRHRNEEGFLARACTTMTFDNCHDYVSLPTNDQFQIYVAADGNFTNGQQHFHIRNINSITLATVELNDASGFEVGEWVSPHPAHSNVTRGQISSISGNTLFLFDVTFGDGMRVGDTIVKASSIDATYHTTGKNVVRWAVKSRPEMNIVNCSATTGNSGVGFLDVSRCALYSTLNISNYTALDQCLIAIRAEHVHYLNISSFNIAMSNVLSDPTGTLSYWTNQGIEIGAATRVTSIGVGNLINCTIKGGNESRQQSQKISSVDVLFLGGKVPIDMKTGKHLTIDGIHARYAMISNCKVRSEKIIGESDYPLSRGIYSHRGRVTDCEIYGANLGIGGAEFVSGGSIQQIVDYAMSELWLEGSERPAMFDNILISDVGRGIFLPDGYNDFRDSIAKISNCIIKNVQHEVITNNSPDLSIELIGNTFIDWGLDTSTYVRGLLDYISGGVQAREIFTHGNSFRATVSNASKLLGNVNSANERIIDRGNNTYPYDANFYWGGGGAKNLISDRTSDRTDVRRIPDDIGVEVKNKDGGSLGFVRFSTYVSRYFFPGDIGDYRAVNIFGGFNSVAFDLVSGEYISFECTLPSGSFGAARSFVGGSSTYCAITTSNKITKSSNIAIEIDGIPISNGASIDGYLNDKNHVIKLYPSSASAKPNIRTFLGSNSGQENVNFPVWNLSMLHSGVNHFYPMDEGSGRYCADENGSGNTIYLNYGSDDNWGITWADN